jgi:hypothetical protein
MKTGLEEMEVTVETGLDEMEYRMDIFEEKLDKMDAVGKACLGKTEASIEIGQEPSEAKSRSDLGEINTIDVGPMKEKAIREPWLPELTLKSLLNWNLFWNKCIKGT